MYRFSFEVNNLTSEPQRYTLNGIALTDQADLSQEEQGYTFMGETSRALEANVTFTSQNEALPKQYDANDDGVTDMADVQVLLDSVNGLPGMTEQKKSAFDLNGDGTISYVMFKGQEGNAEAEARTQFAVEDADKILGLNIGADDYITKPFNPLELVARVKSHMRRYTQLGNLSQQSTDTIYRCGGLQINDDTKEVYVDDEQIKLTPIEYNILLLLVKNAGKVFSIDEIYEKVWNEPSFNADNVVAVHIRRIREKIEINPKEPKYLKVVWGIGYKIDKTQ